jgi:hypothetical protein
MPRQIQSLPFYVRLERNEYQNCGFRNGVIFFPKRHSSIVPERSAPFRLEFEKQCAALRGQQFGPLKADAAYPRDTIM